MLRTRSILALPAAAAASLLGYPAAEAEAPAPPKSRVVFVLGGPGAGKGTQCAMLVEKYGAHHLSAGDLLRAERKRPGSADGAEIENKIKNGQIVPVEITLRLLRNAMRAAADADAAATASSGGGGGDAALFLVDGFPRNKDNLTGWDAAMHRGDVDVEAVLFYDCPEATMEARLLGRGETSGRDDDAVDVIRKRFKTYVDETLPIVQHYDKGGEVPVIRIDGTAERDAVFAHSRAAVERIYGAAVLALNAELLAAIDAGDYATYARLCDAELSCFEPEADGQLVEGLEFHRFFFPPGGAAAAAAPPARSPLARLLYAAPPSGAPDAAGAAARRSTLADARVKLLTPDVALVTYSRVMQARDADGARAHGSVQETRIWQRYPGTQRWRNVHMHRSKR